MEFFITFLVFISAAWLVYYAIAMNWVYQYCKAQGRKMEFTFAGLAVSAAAIAILLAAITGMV